MVSLALGLCVVVEYPSGCVVTDIVRFGVVLSEVVA